MKIAGTTFDNEEGEEIEDIVKVSVIARRMKNLPNKKKMQRKIKVINVESPREINERIDFKQNQSTLFTVRGIN